MVNVIAWPPVGVVGAEWSEIAPVQISRSILTGAERISATQRIRRVVRLTVPGIGRDTMGAGYMEMLKRHLAGVNLVRLNSYPINWHLDSQQNDPTRSSQPRNWTTGGNPLAWTTGGNPLTWYGGAILTGVNTTDGGFPAIIVSGLPPNKPVAKPGEFLTVYADLTDLTESYTVQITAPATSDGDGDALIRLFDALPTGTNYALWPRVNIGTSQTAVFRPETYPRSVQPNLGNWNYDWSFREVFEDEVGSFTEINPWVPT